MVPRAGLLATLVAIGMATSACAKAILASDPDATADVDATTDGAVIDGQIIDATIDATMIDARMIDGPMIDAPIDARICDHSPCDILTQCGCESTPTPTVCDLDFTMLAAGGTTCRAAASGMETTTCTDSTMCAGGYVCASGRCRRYCDDHLDCPGEGGMCIIRLTYGTPPTTIPNLPTTCTTDCVPSNTSNASCPATWACHAYQYDPDVPPVVDGDERFISDCDPAGTAGIGAVCTGNRSCRAGLDCINLSPGGLQCRPSCLCAGTNCTGAPCPAGGGTCRGYTTPLTIGTQTYGVCL